jgi:hypothetical protein
VRVLRFEDGRPKRVANCKHLSRATCRSSGLPHLAPGCKFRGTDSVTGEIAVVQADELGFNDFGEVLAVAGVDFFFRPGRYSCCGVLSIHPHPDQGGDELANLFCVWSLGAIIGSRRKK